MDPADVVDVDDVLHLKVSGYTTVWRWSRITRVSGSYVFWSYEHAYVSQPRGQALSPVVKRYLDYVCSHAFQTADLPSVGFLRISQLSPAAKQTHEEGVSRSRAVRGIERLGRKSLDMYHGVRYPCGWRPQFPFGPAVFMGDGFPHLAW